MNYQKVLIEWEDAIEKDGTWESLEDVKQWAREDYFIVTQMAFILERHLDYLLVCDKVAYYEKEVIVSGAFKIPKSCIKSIKYLEVNDNLEPVKPLLSDT